MSCLFVIHIAQKYFDICFEKHAVLKLKFYKEKKEKYNLDYKKQI
jgi:hypothetical protein